MLAAAGEQLAQFAEDELEGLGVGAGALGGGLVGVDRLAGDGFLLLLELVLDGGELGAVRGLEVDAQVDVGGLDLLVELVGEADVGVADQGVDLGGLGDDFVGPVLGVILEPVFAELDGAGDVGRVDAELDDGLAVADVGDELALRVFRLVLVEIDLGLLVLALEERAERGHVEDLLADGRALVFLEEGLEGLLSGRPVDLREEAGGDTEIDLFGDLGSEVGHIGLHPLVVGDGFREFFAFLGDVAEDEGDRRDHLVLGELLDEILTFRLGLVVAADPAQGDDVVVVGSGDAAELGAVLEDVEEGHVGFPRAFQFEEAEADAVGDEGVVVLVRLEFGLDLLELFEVELGAADGVGLLGVRLRGGLDHARDLGGLGLDRLTEGVGEVHAAQRALVVIEGLAVEIAAESLVGGGFGGGEARVADLQALEVRTDHIDRGAGAAGVDLALELGGLLGQAQLGVHVDEFVGGLATLRRVDAFGGRLFEQADGLRVGGPLEVVGRALGAVDDDLGRKGEGADALLGAGERVGADLLEAGEGLVPLALLGEGFDQDQLGGAAAIVAVEEIFGSLGVFIEESGEFHLGLGPVLHEEETGGLTEGEHRLHAVGDIAGLVLELLEEVEGFLVFLLFEGLVGGLVEDVQGIFLLFSGGQRLGLRAQDAGDGGHGEQDGEQGGLGQLVGAGLLDKHRVRGAICSASGVLRNSPCGRGMPSNKPPLMGKYQGPPGGRSVNNSDPRTQAGRQDGLEPWLLRFLGHHTDLGLDETSFLNPIMEFVLLEAEPAVGVQLPGLFKAVGAQVEHDQTSARLEDAEGLGKGLAGVLGVVQGLAQQGEVDAPVRQGDFLDITEDVGEVAQLFLLGQGPADLDHARRAVHAVDAFGLAGEEAGEGAVTGPEVGDPDLGREQEEHLSDGFPGASWAVVPTQAVGHVVEVLFGLLPALLHDALPGALVGGRLGFAGAGGQGRFDDAADAGREVPGHGVERFLPVASVDHEAALA